MIRNFKDPTTARIWAGVYAKGFDRNLQRVALRKLEVLDAAEGINDLRVPLGNRLERLKGDRIGQYSIRVNQQWRLCFTWKDKGAENVELVDYH